jgi:hypothetical protein
MADHCDNPALALTNFSADSVLHIHRATVEVLCRYLHQNDPFDHEHRYGTVSGLLKVLEQIGMQQQEDSWGVMHSLDEIRRQVRKFQKKLAQAPLADPAEISSALSIAQRARMAPSSLNLHRYTWDLWELRALLAGVPADLAEMGRGVLRRQHFSDNKLDDLDADDLLCVAATRPDEAEETMMRFLVRCSIGEYEGAPRADILSKAFS